MYDMVPWLLQKLLIFELIIQRVGSDNTTIYNTTGLYSHRLFASERLSLHTNIK